MAEKRLSNVTNFTGPRAGPTPLDFEELAKFFEEFKAKAQAGEIDGVATIVSRVDGTIRIARMALPGATILSMLGGTHLLVFELLEDVAQGLDHPVTDMVWLEGCRSALVVSAMHTMAVHIQIEKSMEQVLEQVIKRRFEMGKVEVQR